MKYLFTCFFIFGFLIANEPISQSDKALYERQAKIQSIIDEQMSKGDNSDTQEYNNATSYSNQILNNDDVEFSSDSVQIDVEMSTDHLFEKATTDSYFSNIKKSKNLYANYEKYPKVIFKKQRFEVVVKSIVTTDEFERIETRFINSKDVTVLNPSRQWEYGNKNQFFNKYYFKTESNKFVMPTFQILIYREGRIFEIVTLPSIKIKYTDIATQDESFSNIIADKLEIKSHKTKQYTNKQLLTILEIDAVEGNLEDFKLKNVLEQGITSIDGEYPNQTAIYYAIIPLHTKKLVFDYYNAVTNKFVKIQSNVTLKNELVSTQTDLNPNKSNILLYKKIASAFLAFLFFLIYFIKKRFLYIFLALIFLIICILYNMPNEKIVIKQGSNIYILPTSNSTVFYTTKKLQRVEVLNEKDSYIKILINKENEAKETIGWIKERNIVKN